MSSNTEVSTEPFAIEASAGALNGPNQLIMRDGRHVGILYNDAERREDFDALLALIESDARGILSEILSWHGGVILENGGHHLVDSARAFLGGER